MCAFRYYGGKNSHLGFILPLLPEDAVFVADVFGGSGAIALNCFKVSDGRPHPQVIYNDFDSRLVTFFRVLRKHPEELCRAISLSPHSRADFDEATDRAAWKELDDEIEKARRVFVGVSQSMQSLLRSGANQWSYSKSGYHVRTPQTNAGILAKVADRLQFLSLENKPWDDLLARYDCEDAVFYLDPPYLPEARTSPKA